MKRIVILKVQNNNTIIIGFFNEKGEVVETKVLPITMFEQRVILEKGMELKLIPTSSL